MASSTTRTEAVYQSLRADILGGRRRPGQKLPFADLSATYPASVGVIREALSQLVGEGLVRTEPQQGFFVTPLSRTDLEDLTSARCDIEGLALRRAVGEGDLTWEADLLAAHHRLANTPLRTVDDPNRLNEDWAQLHAVFHETLTAGCRNRRLAAVANQLRSAAELYRRWSIPLGESDRDVAGEHRAILDAVLARDADLAASLLEAHISRTTQLLLQSQLVVDDASGSTPRDA